MQYSTRSRRQDTNVIVAESAQRVLGVVMREGFGMLLQEQRAEESWKQLANCIGRDPDPKRPDHSGLRYEMVMVTVPHRMSALVVSIKVVAGPIGQIAAIVAAILGPRPLQLAACAFGLFTAFVILFARLTTRGFAPDLEGWGAGVVIFGVGWGIGLAVIL